MINVIFAGSPQFAVPALKTLLEAQDIHVSLVISQPDRPAGRRRALTPTAVKQWALEAGIAVKTPAKINEIQDEIAALAPDFLVVIAYGQILRQSVLNIPKYDALNVHASLLPRWRGAAPIQRAILAGDGETGVSVMRMEKGLDTGAVYQMERIPIESSDTSMSLAEKLSHAGANRLLEVMRTIVDKGEAPTPQPQDGITYADKLKKDEGRIDWRRSVEEIDRQIRAFTPWPGTVTASDGNIIKIKRASIHSRDAVGNVAGTVVRIGEEGIQVACGNGILLVQELQSAGKASMPAQQWLNGNELAKNHRFDL